MEHTVRTATFDVLRRLELTTIFSNPGSTEVPFLARAARGRASSLVSPPPGGS